MEAIATTTTATTTDSTSSKDNTKSTKYAAWKVPFECILLDPTRPNVRESYDEEAYQILKASIKVNGVQAPVRLRKIEGTPNFYLAHGFNRYRAVKELREEGYDFPYILGLSAAMNEEQELFFHISANTCQGLTLSEISNILVRLAKVGYTNKQLAEKIGYHEMKVSNLLAYQNKTSQAIKNYVAEGVISVSTATEIARQASSLSEQTEMVDVVVKQKEATGKARTVSLKEVTKKVKFDANSRFGELIEKAPEGELKDSLTNLYYLLNDSSLSVDDILAKIAE